jgi:hypothetical protein
MQSGRSSVHHRPRPEERTWLQFVLPVGIPIRRAAGPGNFFDPEPTLCYVWVLAVGLCQPMLRKTGIGVSFFAFLGLCLISLSDRSTPQLEVFRTALFKGQGLMFKVIYSGGANVADKLAAVCWRHIPCSWDLMRGKIRIEILQPATCSTPSRSLRLTEPWAADEHSPVRKES